MKPIKYSNYISGVLAFCIFIVLPVFMVGHCMLKKPPALSLAENAAKQLEIDSIDARTWAKIYVQNSLKAPKTAEFQNVLDFGVAQAMDKKGKPLKDLWEVSGYVDAQNSFGAMIRTHWYVKLKKNGNSWILLEIKS